VTDTIDITSEIPAQDELAHSPADAWEYWGRGWDRRVTHCREVADNPPGDLDGFYVVARGEMLPLRERPEDGYQDKSNYRPCVTTPRRFCQWLLDETKVGLKAIGPFWVAGFSITQGCNDEEHFEGAMSMGVDIDGGLIRTRAEYEELLDVVMPRILDNAAGFAHLTRSHEPDGPKGWRLRLILFLGTTIRDYDLFSRLGKWVVDQIVNHFGRSEGRDDCGSKAMQAMYPARFENEARLAIFESRFFGVNHTWKPLERLALLEAEREAEKAAEAARKNAVVEARAAYGDSCGGSMPAGSVVADGSVDPMEGARRDLLQLPITAGCGHRNERAPRAVNICREWGLDTSGAVQLLEDHYGRWPDDPDWWRRWVTTCYRHPDTRGHDGRRLAAAQRQQAWRGGIQEYDLDGLAEPVNTEPPRTDSKVLEGPGANAHAEREYENPGNSSFQQFPASTTSPANPWGAAGLAIPVRVDRVSEQYLDLDWEQLPPLVILDSGCGTGKTTAMRRQLEEVIARGGRALRIVPDRACAEGQAAELGLHSHQTPGVRWDRDSLVTTLHSVWKVKLDAELPAGLRLVDLDDEAGLSAPTEHTPFLLVQLDELNELVEAATSKPMRGLRRADAVQRRIKEILQTTIAAGGKIVAGNANVNQAAIRWLHRLLGWKPGERHDWALVLNDHLTLRPEIVESDSVHIYRWRCMEAWRRGEALCAPCGTKGIADEEARLFALRTMSERAGFDVEPFAGRSGMDALADEDRLPELVAELAQRGLRLADVRPKILVMHSERLTADGTALLADASRIWDWDAVFFTPIAGRGVSWVRPMTVCALYHEGAGPGAETLFQHVFRCRLPIGNLVHVYITGDAPVRSEDPVDWYVRHQRVDRAFADEVEGLCEYSVERRDGTPWAVEFNEDLLWMLAESNARQESLAHIRTRTDEYGNVLQKGDFALLCEARKLTWRSTHGLDRQLDTRTPEGVEAEKVEHRERRTAIRAVDDRELREEPPIKYEDAKVLERQGKRDPKSRRQIRAAKIRRKYGLAELTQADIDRNRKHGEHDTTAGTWLAYEADEAATIKGFAEKCGPIKIQQDKELVRARCLKVWTRVIAPAGLESATQQQTPLESFGAWLAQHPDDREMFSLLFGYRVADEDLVGMGMTTLLLRVLSLKAARKKDRVGGRRQVWVRRIKPESWDEMIRRSQPTKDRILDPEGEEKAWAAIEARTFAAKPPTLEEVAEEAQQLFGGSPAHVADIEAEEGPFPMPMAA
jgi:hypothetical protein